MRWTDRVYGESRIEDPALLRLIESPSFRRLRGVRQAGPSALVFPFKDVTRFEHSLGVFLLLRRLGADRLEQVAGLLHDISHTAFSHAVDFLFDSEEQNHHEGLKPAVLRRPDLAGAIRGLGFEPGDFDDDARFGLLERPLPALCADRVDYFLRDGIACGVVGPSTALTLLEDLTIVDGAIAFRSVDLAVEARRLFAEMNAEWWAGPVEAFIYNNFAEVLRHAFRDGSLREDDLMSDDESVLRLLRERDDPFIEGRLDAILALDRDAVRAFEPRVIPKARWLDPPVASGGSAVPLSRLEAPPGSAP